jgi:hypothetical protein
MSEVGRPIQWIDDPAVLALRALVIGFFLRQNRMVGKIAPDDFNDLTLRLAVNRRNQIDSALEIDLFGLEPALPHQRRGGVGSAALKNLPF